MTATILDGKKISAEIREELKGETARLKAKGVVPGLAGILVGEDPGSTTYGRLKAKACEEAVGVSAIGLSMRGSIKKVGTPYAEPTGVCIGCGACSQVCPVEVPDAFNAGLTKRKAVYLPVPHNIPNTYVVDMAACALCGQCEKACPTHAYVSALGVLLLVLIFRPEAGQRPEIEEKVLNGF
jgi:ferredoxin